MKGKLIIIEGTDSSGKETQSNLLIEKLRKENFKIEKYSFPMYDTPTGKIVGGPYLGKNYICEGWFPETAPKVDPQVSALYYAADRKYNIDTILENLDNGINVLLDRYTFSNMGHQGGKLKTKKERNEMFEWIGKLEFDFLQLPKPDISILLYMPNEKTIELKKKRIQLELLDQNEADDEHISDAERAYLEIAEKYQFKTIDCVDENDRIRTIEDINEELYNYVNKKIRSA